MFMHTKINNFIFTRLGVSILFWDRPAMLQQKGQYSIKVILLIVKREFK